jgi:hypothetical protein
MEFYQPKWEFLGILHHEKRALKSTFLLNAYKIVWGKENIARNNSLQVKVAMNAYKRNHWEMFAVHNVRGERTN